MKKLKKAIVIGNVGLGSTCANTMLDDVKIKKQIEQNREEINNWLNGDYPLDIVYTRINMLSEQNKRLIEKLKSIRFLFHLTHVLALYE